MLPEMSIAMQGAQWGGGGGGGGGELPGQDHNLTNSVKFSYSLIACVHFEG